MANYSKLYNADRLQQNQYNQNMLRQQQLANQMSYAKLHQMDPYFALGNLIGNAFFENMNRRGVKKEKAAIQEALDAYQGDNNYQAMNNILDTAPVMNGTNGTLAVDAGVPSSVNPSETTNYMTGSVAQPNSYINTPNNNLSSFDLDKFKAEYFQNALKRNRSQQQIEQAWDDMSPQLNAMNEQAKAARLGELSNKFGSNVSMGDADFMQNISKLAEDYPDLATMQIKRAQANDKYDNALKLAAMRNKASVLNNNARLANALELAKLRQAYKTANGVGTNKNPLSSILQIDKAIGNLQKKYVDEMGQPVNVSDWNNPDDVAMYNYYDKMKKSLMGIGNSASRETTTATKKKPYVQPDINEYNQALVDDIGLAISTLSGKKNYNKQMIVNAIYDHYKDQIAKNGGPGYLEKILNEVDWGPNGFDVRQ